MNSEKEEILNIKAVVKDLISIVDMLNEKTDDNKFQIAGLEVKMKKLEKAVEKPKETPAFSGG